jgi:uncharacterized tellurite resistance protein B-like protein
MLKAIADLIDRLASRSASSPASQALEEADVPIAAAALLLHIASVDGELSAGERDDIARLIGERFGLSGTDTAEIVRIAAERENEAVDLHRFTSVLKRNLDDDGRLAIVRMLWRIAFSDGQAHEFEENTIWRIAELIGVSSRDRMALRRLVAGEAAAPPET